MYNVNWTDIAAAKYTEKHDLRKCVVESQIQVPDASPLIMMKADEIFVTAEVEDNLECVNVRTFNTRSTALNAMAERLRDYIFNKLTD